MLFCHPQADRHASVRSVSSSLLHAGSATPLSPTAWLLQGMRARRLWAYEDISLRQQELPSARALASLVNSFVAALAFERGLTGAWSGIALDWALYCRSRHLACRWGGGGGGGGLVHRLGFGRLAAGTLQDHQHGCCMLMVSGVCAVVSCPLCVFTNLCAWPLRCVAKVCAWT
jgi:hypothetical protein